MAVYPKEIRIRCDSKLRIGVCDGTNAEGSAVNFSCGCYATFTLRINANSKTVEKARFRSNGCGFMVAAADMAAELITGSELTRLHGLNDVFRYERLGAFSDDRVSC